jgi:hypothetical protein
MEAFGGKPWPLTVIVLLAEPAVGVMLAADDEELVVLLVAVLLLTGADVELAAAELELVAVLVEDAVAVVEARLFTIFGVSIEALSVYVAMNELLPVALSMSPFPLNTIEPESPVVDPALLISVTA